MGEDMEAYCKLYLRIRYIQVSRRAESLDSL